jgi:hypothetical protein
MWVWKEARGKVRETEIVISLRCDDGRYYQLSVTIVVNTCRGEALPRISL